MHVAATLPSELGHGYAPLTAPGALGSAALTAPGALGSVRRATGSVRRATGLTPAALTASVALVLAVAGATLAVGIRRVAVEGDSMRPALAPGDRLLVVRLPRAVHLRPGAVVAAADPRMPRRLLVKRVEAVDAGGGVVLRGDNPGASTDSRSFGPVARRSVWGVAWYRYAPPERAGRLER